MIYCSMLGKRQPQQCTQASPEISGVQGKTTTQAFNINIKIVSNICIYEFHNKHIVHLKTILISYSLYILT